MKTSTPRQRVHTLFNIRSFLIVFVVVIFFILISIYVGHRAKGVKDISVKSASEVDSLGDNACIYSPQVETSETIYFVGCGGFF